MILNKRIKREFKGNAVRYLALLFMIMMGMGIVIGMASGANSITETIKKYAEKNKVEDGEFSLFVPLTEEDKKYLEKREVQLEEKFYQDFLLEDKSTIRISKNRKDINLIELDEGALAKKDNEIVLEKHYAKKHGYKLKDKIKVGTEDYIITGIGTVPDYNLVTINPSDVSANSELFGLGFVNEKGYKNLKESKKAKGSEEYSYSYLLNGEMTSIELRKYLADMEFDKDKITDIYMKEIISEVEDGKNKLVDGTEELASGSSEIYDGSKELNNGADEINKGSITIDNEYKKLDKGINDISKGINSLDSGIGELEKGISSVKEGGNSLKDGLGEAVSKNDELKNGAKQVFDNMLEQSSKQINMMLETNISLNIGNYGEVLNGMINNPVYEKAKGVLLEVKGQLDSYNAFYGGLNNYLTGVKEAYSGSEKLVDGTDELVNGATDLKEGSSKINSASKELRKGSIEFKEGTEKLKEGSTELNSGVKELTEANKELNKGTEEFQNEINKFVDENMNYSYENLTAFLASENNPRINGAIDDAKVNEVASLIAGVIFLILIGYMIAVFMTNNIEKESAVIGTLYSMGYLKKELLKHFMILPLVIVTLGGVFGTIIGFNLIEGLSASSAEYFSYPSIERVYSVYLMIYGIGAPIAIALAINLGILNKKLSREPLKLLKKEQKQKKESKIKLKGLDFINTYRIRQLLREFSSNIVLAFGLFLAIILMMFAFTIQGSIENLIKSTSEDVKFEYMYLLKYPPENIEKGEKCYTESLKIDYPIINGEMDVALQGIDKENKYYSFKVDPKENEVYISNAVATKFGYKKGDNITLLDNLENKNYTFKVGEIVDYSYGLYIFMDIEDMRRVFEKEEDYYNTVLSGEKLNIENGRIFSVTTYDDVIKGVTLFRDNMKSLIVMLLVVSVIIFILVMYLLLKMMIDKSTFSISLIKVFGFNDREINKIYIGTSLYTVGIVTLIGIPIGKMIMNYLYPMLVASVQASMPAYISGIGYLVMVSIIGISYFVVNILLKKYLKKVSLVEILKDRE